MLNIIIPVYHSRDTLPRALQSLENQTDRKFLVTVVADGDGEDYSDIIAASSLRISFFALGQNAGPGAARQFGVDKTPLSIRWVMFLDADDYLQPRAVEILTYEAEHCNADLVASSIIHEEKVGVSTIIPAKKAQIWVHGKIYSHDFLVTNGIKFPKTYFNEDCLFNNICFLNTEKAFFVEEPLVIWKNHEGSLTRSKDICAMLTKSIQGYAYNTTYLFDLIREEGLKINSTLKNPDFVLKWIVALYQQWMDYYTVCGRSLENVETELKKFFAYPEVQSVLKRPRIMQKAEPATFYCYDDKLYFYRLSFDEFIYRFSGIRLDENYDYRREE